jgi:hypothetical protein
MLKPPPGLIGRDARHHAHKLVAADADQQIVGAHLASQPLNDVPQNLVADAVAVLVADCLQTSYVHVRRHESLARSARPVDLALKLLQPNPATVRAGQFISPGLLAVASGLLSIALPELPVNGGEMSITPRAFPAQRGPPAGREPPLAQLPHPQRAPIQQREDVGDAILKRNLTRRLDSADLSWRRSRTTARPRVLAIDSCRSPRRDARAAGEGGSVRRGASLDAIPAVPGICVVVAHRCRECVLGDVSAPAVANVRA